MRENGIHVMVIVVALIIGVLVTVCVRLSLDETDDQMCPAPRDNSVAACVVTLPDTRRVTCVRANNGGITCDWDHTDGADKGWDK